MVGAGECKLHTEIGVLAEFMVSIQIKFESILIIQTDLYVVI